MRYKQIRPTLKILSIFHGGAEGIRTPDLNNANVARYQLC